MTDCVFDLHEVSYTYPNAQSGLDEVTVRISPGERVAVLGANASGKSTLLQLLDGLIFPTSGKITTFGQELSERSIEGTPFGRFFRQQVAFLFQNVDSQLFCATVEEELAFGPRHLGMAEYKIVQRIDDLLDIFRLHEIRSRPPQMLSGGEKRRVGLAAILAVGPSVILLDEPTAGLDPRNRAFLMDVLQDLSDAGKTLIVATHDLQLARDVDSRTVVLGEDHRVAVDGKVSDILDDLELLTRVNLTLALV